MATRTLGPQYGWAVGETINVYERDIRNQPTGSSVDSATVASDSTVTFSSLASDTKYIATDGTNAVQFGTLTDPDTGGGGGGGISQEDLDDAIAAHAADTTSVHGISSTASLATSSSVTSAISAHAADTTDVHGISDTQYIKGAYVDVDGGASFRPDFISVDFVVADDPASVAVDGDTWPPTEAP